jgi:hypothetical protein
MSETFRFTPPPKPTAPEPPDVDEEPEYDPRARLDYLNTVNPPKKKHIWLRILIGLIVLVLLAGAAAYAYPRFFKKETITTKQSTTQTKQTTTKTEDKVATKEFDSTFFNLGFAYPATWTVNENTETSRLTAVSPATSQKTGAGTTEFVRTVMTIAPKGQNMTAFEKGSALAILSSEKIKYSSPTSAQRAETYLSFIQYSTTASGSGLDGIYITGDNGYQKDQYIPKTDMDGRDPLVAITFEKCADAKCTTTPAAVTMPSSIWNDTSFKDPILTMLKSLSVN